MPRKPFAIGPKSREQLSRLASTWRQGEHVLVSGGTGSGKTILARHLDEIRLQRRGFVIVFVCKLRTDETIVNDYSGWTRWKKWKKNAAPHENKILLWPDTTGLPARAARELQRDIFRDAIDGITIQGKWTVHIDEGLYFCSSRYMNMEDDLALMQQMGRSSGITCVTLTQRPAHLPLVVYSSASHAFIGRARETTDVKRLSELGAQESAKELAARIRSQGRHDFLWVPVAPDWESESMNLRN